MNEFKKLIINALKEVLGAEYKVIGNIITKTNDEMLHSITIIKNDEKLSKNIYLENYFEEYPERSIEEIVDDIIGVYFNQEAAMEDCLEFVEHISDYEDLKHNIFMKLVNKEKNSEYIKDKCYVHYLDLAAIFYVLIAQNDGSSFVVTVTQVLRDLWKVSIEELYNQALKNIEESNPPIIKSINQVLGDIIDVDWLEESGKGLGVYVMSNKNNTNGAISMILLDTLKEFADENNTDEIIIIPSSIHEVLLYPKKEGNDISEENCLEMLLEVNDTVLKKTEFLSNNIYVYSTKCNEVSIWNKN